MYCVGLPMHDVGGSQVRGE